MNFSHGQTRIKSKVISIKSKIFSFIVCLLLIGCIGTGKRETLNQVQNDMTDNEIVLIDSVVFENPIIDICIDKGRNLLVLDASLEKIFVYSLQNKTVNDTIFLPQRINFLKKLATDNIYLYLYTDNSLFRYDNLKEQLTVLISQADRIRINDIAVSPEGDIFIADGAGNQILVIDYLGKISVFNKPGRDIFIPSNIFYDTDNRELLVINKAQNRIETYSRIGNMLSSNTIPDNFYVEMDKHQNRILTLQNNLKNIDFFENGKYFAFIKDYPYTIKSFLIANNHLFILDDNKTIREYLLQF